MYMSVNLDVRAIVEECSRACEDDSLVFRRQLAKLAAVSVEGYYADLRRSLKTYYLFGGDTTIEVVCRRIDAAVARDFDPDSIVSAIHQSRTGACTYRRFCEQLMAAGCAGYFVSLMGRRVLYFSRSAETYVEFIPPY